MKASCFGYRAIFHSKGSLSSRSQAISHSEGLSKRNLAVPASGLDKSQAIFPLKGLSKKSRT
jgi:hypothetical protein